MSWRVSFPPRSSLDPIHDSARICRDPGIPNELKISFPAWVRVARQVPRTNILLSGVLMHVTRASLARTRTLTVRDADTHLVGTRF